MLNKPPEHCDSIHFVRIVCLFALPTGFLNSFAGLAGKILSIGLECLCGDLARWFLWSLYKIEPRSAVSLHRRALNQLFCSARNVYLCQKRNWNGLFVHTIMRFVWCSNWTVSSFSTEEGKAFRGCRAVLSQSCLRSSFTSYWTG